MTSTTNRVYWIQHLITLLVAFLLALTIFMMGNAHYASAQDYPSQPVSLFVRDGAGNRLQGVTLDIYVTGPPHEFLESCVTGADGGCHLMIPPKEYLVLFRDGYRGFPFVPSEEQNGGMMSDAGLGGYGISFQPDTEEQSLLFVLGLRNGQIMPLWDLAASPNDPPQPFINSEDPFAAPADALAEAGVTLDPLAPEVAEATSEPTTEAGPAAPQVVVDYYEFPTAAAAIAPTTVPLATQPATRETDLPPSAINQGILGILILFMIGISGFVLIRYLQHRRAKQKA
jgi:hypothetical protein